MITPYRYTLILLLTLLAACSTTDPVKEDTPEAVSQVILTFTPTGATPVIVTATDPDGEGVQDITVDGPIDLLPNTTYVMTIQLINGLVAPGQPGYDLTEEVEEEGVEHQFFFAWTNDVFSNPTGNGNFDNGADPVNYTGGTNSKDANGLNLGITTTWTSTDVTASGTFRVVLKHQPGTKTSMSDATVGETDIDLTFTVNVQ
jgi:hypothetical protein